jgi:hypothetical protein
LPAIDLRQHGLLDQLVQDALEQHIIGQGLVFFGQVLAQGDHVAQRDPVPLTVATTGRGGLAFGPDRKGQRRRPVPPRQKAHRFCHSHLLLIVPRPCATLTIPAPSPYIATVACDVPERVGPVLPALLGKASGAGKAKRHTITQKAAIGDNMLGLGTLARKVFGTPNDRKVKSVRPLVAKINALEPEFAALTDEGIIEKTREFQKRVQEGGEALDAILPEAFANCREARSAPWACAPSTCS